MKLKLNVSKPISNHVEAVEFVRVLKEYGFEFDKDKFVIEVDGVNVAYDINEVQVPEVEDNG